MPPTLITADRDAIRAFRDEHKDIIVKPLYGNGGAGVFHVRPDDENLDALLEMFTQLCREPVIVQRYLPEVRQGRQAHHPGRRQGGGRRQSRAGRGRGALQHACRRHGGEGHADARATARSARSIGPALTERGLIFVGIDVIGDYLTEINVTSPTGIQEINRFDGVSLEALIWDRIEVRYQETRGGKT